MPLPFLSPLKQQLVKTITSEIFKQKGEQPVQSFVSGAKKATGSIKNFLQKYPSPASFTFKKVLPEIGKKTGPAPWEGPQDFGKWIMPQAAGRFVVGAGMEAFRKPTGKGIQSYTPKSEFAQTFLGEEEIRPLSQQLSRAQQVGSKLYGAKPGELNVRGAILGPIGLTAFAGLEVTPFGKSTKTVQGASKAIAKMKNADEITKTLQKVVKGDDNVIKQLSERLVDVKDENLIARSIKQARQTIYDKQSQAIKAFDLDKTGEELLRSTLDRIPYKKRTVTWEETMQAAKEMGINAGELSKKKASKLDGTELLMVRNIINNNIDYISKAQNTLSRGKSLSDDVVEELGRKIEIAGKQNEELLQKFMTARSQMGRDLNSLKIMANRTLDPAVWMANAKRLLGDKPFTKEISDDIMRYIKDSDRVGLINYMSKLRKSGVLEKGTTMWKAGLLTNPTTHMVNIIGNTGMAVMEAAKDLPAVILDLAISPITGKRTKTFGLSKTKAGWEGTKEGFKKMGNYIKTGVDPDEVLKKFDIPSRVNFENTLAHWYTESVFRALGGADKVFRQRMFKRALFEEAHTTAKNLGLKGKEFKTKVQKLYMTPTDEMVSEAIDAAEYATFLNENALAKGISSMKKGLEKRGGAGTKAAFEILAPFVRTPTNIAKVMADYSPFGAVTTLLDIARKGKKGLPIQKRLVEGLGRSMTGTGVIGLGSYLASQGLMTGNIPETEAEKEFQYTVGKQPASVKIGDTWYQINRISPIGNLLVLGAELHELKQNALEEGKTNSEAILETIKEGTFAGIKGLTEQTFLKGVSGGLSAITQPERFAESFVDRTVKSVVPSVIGAITRGIDPVYRDPEGTVQHIMSRIPGLSKKVDPKLDITGREKKIKGGIIRNLFNPVYVKEETEDPILQELGRLKIEQKIPEKEKLSIEGFESISLNKKGQKEYTRQAGKWYYKYLQGALNSPEWTQLNDAQRKEVIDDLFEGAKDMAEMYMQQEYLKKLQQGNVELPKVKVPKGMTEEQAEQQQQQFEQQYQQQTLTP